MLETSFGSQPALDDKYVSGGARSSVIVCRKRLLSGSPSSSNTLPKYSMSVAICFDAIELSWQILVICSSYIAQHSSTRSDSSTSVLGVFCEYFASHNSRAVLRCVDGDNKSGSRCCGKVNKYWPIWKILTFTFHSLENTQKKKFHQDSLAWWIPGVQNCNPVDSDLTSSTIRAVRHLLSNTFRLERISTQASYHEHIRIWASIPRMLAQKR